MHLDIMEHKEDSLNYDGDDIFENFGECNDESEKEDCFDDTDYDKAFEDPVVIKKRRRRGHSVTHKGEVLRDEVGNVVKTDMSILNKWDLSEKDLDDLMLEDD